MSSRLQRRVLDEFETWARLHPGVPRSDSGQRRRERIAILLQGRARYLGKPDPTRWRSGDVRELLMTYVAPRQVDAWDLAGLGIETVRDFLRFLDGTDRLHPASTRVPTLLKELDRLGPKYAAAMADSSGWRLAKRIFTAALADGIPIDAEPAVLEEWAERFSARDAEERRPVLGDLVDRDPGYATGRILIHDGQVVVLASGAPAMKHLVWPDHACDCGCDERAEFPPIALRDKGVLAKEVAAGGAGLLRQLAALGAWVNAVDPGVDDHGDLLKKDRIRCLEALGLPVDEGRRAEVPALTRLWRTAIEFDIIQVRRTRLTLGAGADLVSTALAGSGDPEQTLELWSDLADALIDPTAPASARKGADELRDWLRPWVPRFLGQLYANSAAGGPTDLDGLTDRLMVEYKDQLPPGEPDLFAGIAAVGIRQTLGGLAQHGAVSVTGVDGEYDQRVTATAAVLGTAAWTLSRQAGVLVELTDLGRYLVRQRLLAEDAHAPLIG